MTTNLEILLLPRREYVIALKWDDRFVEYNLTSDAISRRTFLIKNHAGELENRVGVLRLFEYVNHHAAILAVITSFLSFAK